MCACVVGCWVRAAPDRRDLRACACVIGWLGACVAPLRSCALRRCRSCALRRYRSCALRRCAPVRCAAALLRVAPLRSGALRRCRSCALRRYRSCALRRCRSCALRRCRSCALRRCAPVRCAAALLLSRVEARGANRALAERFDVRGYPSLVGVCGGDDTTNVQRFPPEERFAHDELGVCVGARGEGTANRARKQRQIVREATAEGRGGRNGNLPRAVGRSSCIYHPCLTILFWLRA